jgi:hypothetical protein
LFDSTDASCYFWCPPSGKTLPGVKDSKENQMKRMLGLVLALAVMVGMSTPSSGKERRNKSRRKEGWKRRRRQESGRKEGRKEEGRKERRKEGRKERREKGRQEVTPRIAGKA